MAKTLEELKIKLGLEGVEEIAKVKSSLRGLGSTADITGKSLQQIAKGVKNFSAKGGESINVIKGQVTALKGLQAQAAINSKTFNQLGRDIALYESKLKKAEKTAETSQAALRRRGSFVKATPGRFLEREDFLRGKKIEEAFDAEGRVNPQFLAQQAQLNVLAEARTRIEGRLAAAVAATTRVQVDNNKKTRSAAEIVKTFGAELNELPRTTNNLQMELRELRTDLGALVIGGEEYIQTLNRINQIQSQLDLDPLDPTGRKAEIRSRLGTTGRFGGETDPVAKSIARNRRRRERGALPPLMLDQPREASGLFRTIAAIGSAETKAATEMMGRSLSQVTAEIKRQAAASNGSVNSLNAQKTAFAQLRAGLDPTSKDFRELGKEIDKVDRKLGKLGKKRFSLKGTAQTVGAVASAGIFGGAAGAAGALAGAPFGPGGAVIGGGIGTSVGVAAQQISSFTNYAASISLAEKAMARILEKENNRIETARRLAIANETIEYAVSRLNVEREDATVGMTRLSAAVLGAGGNIETAAIAFLGTTKAIKATKGSAEDVRGGLTALVQMFSKGKISAEELSGQLGERFPAAVTAFADANDISTQELQKMLKNGEVGLDRLVKFLSFITKKYSAGALEMASSAEESGERQKRAFDEVRRELGKQLISVGERLQEGVTDSLVALTPVIVNIAKAVAGAITLIVDGIVVIVKNFRNLIDAVTVLAGGAVLGSLLTMLVKVKTAMGAKGLAFSVALLARFIRMKLTAAVGGLILKLKALALTMARNPITLLALGITALGVSMFRASRRHKDFIDDITSGVMSLEDAGKRVDKYKKRLETLNKIQSIIEEDPTAARGLQEAGRSSRPMQLTGMAGRVQQLASSLQDSSLPAISVGTTEALGQAQAVTASQIAAARVAIAGRAPTEDGFDIEQLLEKMFAPGLSGGDFGGDGDKDITAAQLETRIAGLREAVTLKELEAKFFNDIRSIQADEIEGNKKILAFYEAGTEYSKARAALNKELVGLEQELGALVKKAELDLGLITEEQYEQFELEQKRIQLEEKFNALLLNEKMTKEEIAEAIDKIINGLEAANDKAEDFESTFKKGLEDMINVAPKLANVALDAITGVADGLVDMIATGQANFKKFAAEILKDIAKIMMRAALAKAVKNIFGSADGNVIQSGQIKPYAKGGIVAAPTFFPMKGNNVGLMGEAGPEAILPLRPGPDGRLGVENTGASRMNAAMSRYSRNGVAPGQMTDADGMPAAGGMGGGSAELDVRYNVERINNVDYVTAAEFEQGMTQAAKRGAELGRRNVYSDLVNKRSIRSRVAL